MARPRLPVGTMGDIRYHPASNGQVRAVTQFRDYDGVTRQVERRGKSAAAARSRLREACRDRGRTDSAAEITSKTTVAALAELWFSQVQAAVDAGDYSPGTSRAYRDRLDHQVVPALGALLVGEVTVGRVDRLLRATTERHGAAVAKTTRTVLSGMLGLAARHDALDRNPVRDAGKIRGESEPAYSLELEQVWDLRAKLAADQKAVDLDLVDFVDMMMATGLRIGETAAITWPALDLDSGSVEVRGTVIRIRGVGLVIKPKPKSEAGWRSIELPSWCTAMARRRKFRPANPWEAVFTSPTGLLRDPSNTQADLREVFARVGYPSVTSHTFRKTVGSLMDDAGLSARAAADQLGHAKVSMTQDRYFGRKVRATGGAAVLEAVERTSRSERHG
jgi:integrase